MRRVGILKKQKRTGEGGSAPTEEGEEYVYYVPAPVQPIIENIDDVMIPTRRCAELSQQEREWLNKRERAMRVATVAKYGGWGGGDFSPRFPPSMWMAHHHHHISFASYC